MKNRTLKTLLLSASFLCVSGIVATTGITLAGFSAKTLVNRTVGVAGKTPNTVYLNANIWEVDNAVYFMKRFNSTDGTKLMWIPVSKLITPTVQSVDFTLHVFEYDTSIRVSNLALDKFIFVRMNPNGTHIPTAGSTTDLPASEWNETGDTFWNKSKEVTYNSDYAYHCVEKWDESQSDSLKKAIVNYNSNRTQIVSFTGSIDA